MHSRRVVNRDVKPANIMVQEDKRAVIIDFNVSKAGPIEEKDPQEFNDQYSPRGEISNDEEFKDPMGNVSNKSYQEKFYMYTK